MVESQPSKLLVAGSIPVSRSKRVFDFRSKEVFALSALHEQAVLTVNDPAIFRAVQSDIESSYSSAKIESFLKSLKTANLRIRDFEDVAKAGKLGATTAANYAKLDNSDQGQIRELYLASLEKVDLALRNKYFKLYAYY